MSAAPELSIVIPAYREARRIGPTLERIDRYLEARGLLAEILVADDGSDDGTAGVVTGFAAKSAARSTVIRLLRTEENLGKGAATRRGVLASRGRRVLLTDADLSTPIEDLERLERAAREAELVFGSRAVPDARVVVHQPRYRELMGKTFNKLIRLAGVRGLRDTQCGFKLLYGEVARDLFARMVTPGFAYDVELAWLARRSGYRIAEVGVTWVNSPDTRVRAVRDSLAMLAEIVRFRWRHRTRPGE